MTNQPLLTDHDLERLTGQKVQTWRLRRMRGDSPPYIKLGGRVLYDPGAVEEYLAARRFTSTSDETTKKAGTSAAKQVVPATRLVPAAELPSLTTLRQPRKKGAIRSRKGPSGS